MKYVNIQAAKESYTGYHVSPGKNLNSILSKGLLVNSEKIYHDKMQQATIGGIYFSLGINDISWSIRNIQHNIPSIKDIVLVIASLQKEDMILDEDEFIDFDIPDKSYSAEKSHDIDYMYSMLVKHNKLWKLVSENIARSYLKNFINNEPRAKSKSLILEAMKQVTSKHTFKGTDSVMVLTDVKYKTNSHIKGIVHIGKEIKTYRNIPKKLVEYLPKFQRELV